MDHQTLRFAIASALAITTLGGCAAAPPDDPPVEAVVARRAALRRADEMSAGARTAKENSRHEVRTTPEIQAETGIASYVFVAKGPHRSSILGLDENGHLRKGFKVRTRRVAGEEQVEVRSRGEHLIVGEKQGVLLSTLSAETIAHMTRAAETFHRSDVAYAECSLLWSAYGLALFKLGIDVAKCGRNPADQLTCLQVLADVGAVTLAGAALTSNACIANTVCLEGMDGQKVCADPYCFTDSQCEARFEPLDLAVTWTCEYSIPPFGGFGVCNLQHDSVQCIAEGGTYDWVEDICEQPACADDYEFDPVTRSCISTDRDFCAALDMILDEYNECATCPEGTDFDPASRTCVGCDPVENPECEDDPVWECDPSTDPDCVNECNYDGSNWCSPDNEY